MADFSMYPSLERLIALLSMTTFPSPREADDDDVNSDNGEEVIGILTSGEAHLYLAMMEAEEISKKAGTDVEDEGDLTPDIVKKVHEAAFFNASFWSLLYGRMAENLDTKLPRVIGVRKNFQIVRCFEDCGCDKGLRCAVVRAGLIDPRTGVESVPETSEGAMEALTFIKTEGGAECIKWCDELLTHLSEHTEHPDPDDADAAEEEASTGFLAN